MKNAQIMILADSISDQSIRLTTFQLRYWRGIHSELMTHRVFSRNAGSSRARPSAAIRKQVWSDPWGPLAWGMNRPGMTAGEESTGIRRWLGQKLWRGAAKAAVVFAYALEKLRFHKQIVNRILEPFTYIDVVVSSTSYNNWFGLRNHPDADPTIHDLAAGMQFAYQKSVPTPMKPGDWHLPYITNIDRVKAFNFLKEGRITRDQPRNVEVTELLKKISTARCARVSYKAFDGETSLEKDLELYNKLIVAEPLHASPSEHQAMPDTKVAGQIGPYGEWICEHWALQHLHGNFHGWVQYRKTLPNEFIEG